MTSPVSHIQLNVSDKKALKFYKDLLEYLNFKEIMGWDSGFGMERGGFGLWIMLTEQKHLGNKFHRKNTGINHLAFKVESKNEVDKFNDEFLKPRGIKPLYDSPKSYPDYSENYYAVYFEDPDRIKLEIAFYD